VNVDSFAVAVAVDDVLAAETEEIVLKVVVSDILSVDLPADVVKNVLAPGVKLVGTAETNAVLLTGKKLPDNTLGCREPLVPEAADNAAPLEAEARTTI
jgi:hypothetical protein